MQLRACGTGATRRLALLAFALLLTGAIVFVWYAPA